MDTAAKTSQKTESVSNEHAKGSALPYTHFISLPLAIHPELVEKVTRFKSIILGDGDLKDVNRPKDNKLGAGTSGDADLRIDDSIFLEPQTLHLTVLMLKLWNNERIQAAIDILKGIHSRVNEVLDNRPLFVRLKGLDLMGRTRTKEEAQVLYAPVDEIGKEGRLPLACQIITDAYVGAGLAFEKDIQRKLTFHVTLMNTKFRQGWNMKKEFDSFDATHVLQQFGSEEWGDYHIREAHLSKRFVYDANGYFHCCASTPFPDITRARIFRAKPIQAKLKGTATGSDHA